MPNAQSLRAIAQGHLIQTVDDQVPGRAKMLPADRTEFNLRLSTLETSDNSTALTESNRAGGSGTARTALETMQVLAHDGYHGFAAIRSSTITPSQRLEVFTAYGWASGKIGVFNDARILGLCRLALADDLDLENPAWGYSADLKAEIAAQLAIFEAHADDRTGGERMAATKTRNLDLASFETMLSRVWHFLCSATDDTDQWPDLRRYGFNVRKDRSPNPATPAPPAA